MRYVGRQNFIMPTTCVVVGCHNRQSIIANEVLIASLKRKNAVEDGLPLCRARIMMVRLRNWLMETVFVYSISSRARSQTCTPTRTMCHQFRLRIRQILNVMQPCHISNVLAIAPNCRWNEEGKKRESPWRYKEWMKKGKR